MSALSQQWRGFLQLPSACLLLLQFLILMVALITHHHPAYHAITWTLGVLVLLMIAKVIRQSTTFRVFALVLVAIAVVSSLFLLLGVQDKRLAVLTYASEALAYFLAAYALIRYMFADRYLTKDELFAAAAVFTLLVWGFAFLYGICQVMVPASFVNSNQPQGAQSWLDLLFLSVSLQSSVGLSDIMPISPAARVVAMLQMFAGVMYLALIVTRLITLQYIQVKRSE